MLRRVLFTLLLTTPVFARGIHAQPGTYEASIEGSAYEDMAVGEFRDVPCEYSYGHQFYSYYGVEFEGQMFMSQWRSKSSNFPLPAWNWYYALPMRDVVSNNGKYRWDNAEIQIHCWVYRSLYGLTIHRDHVASLGQLVELCEGDWRLNVRREDGYDDGGDGSRLGSSRYDPYARSSWGATEFCSADNDGGGGGAGGTQYYPGDYTNGETVGWADGVGTGGYSACGQDAKVEYVCIDVWVDGVGWTEWSCGYTTTC